MPYAVDPLMRSPLWRPVLARFRAAGGDTGELLRAHRLPSDTGRVHQLVAPLSRVRAVYEHAADLLGDPFLGTAAALDCPRGTYGLLEFYCRSAPTVGAAFARLAQYIALSNDVVEVRFDTRGDEALLEQRAPPEPHGLGRVGNEFFVVWITLMIRRLTGLPIALRQAWFAHSRPADTARLTAELGTTALSFDAEGNGIALDAAVLHAPLSSADPPLSVVLGECADQALPTGAGRGSTVEHVRRQIARELASGGAELGAAAHALGVTRRTLQRRLADAGTSFHAELDAIREGQARREVRDGDRPLAEIAYLLGYSEPSAFLRAFRRWTGMSAGAFRARTRVSDVAPRGASVPDGALPPLRLLRT